MAHALDALALMSLRHACADEGKRNRVEPAVEHGIDVEHQLARDAVLIRRHAEIERMHRPFDRGPVQRRKAGADSQRALSQVGAGRWKNGGAGIVLVHRVLQPQQVLPRCGKCHGAVAQHDALVELGSGACFTRLQLPRAVACGLILEQHPLPGSRLKAGIGPLLHRCSRQFRAQRGPIQAEVGADARVIGNAEIVLDQKPVDASHQMAME